MKLKKISMFIVSVLIPVLVFGCSSSSDSDSKSDGKLLGSEKLFSQNGDDNSGIFYANGGTQFNAWGNPIIDNETKRNSSDPAIWVYKHPVLKKDVLMMVTSCDMDPAPAGKPVTEYPMNTTYLYTSLVDDSHPNGIWYDHGDVVSENDFDWTLKDSYNTWAPDLQYVPGSSPGTGKFYLYVPAKDTSGVQRIGISIASENNSVTKDGKYGICDKFVPETEYLKINGYSKNKGYSYDPGICDIDNGSGGTDYYMTFCDDNAPNGRNHIAKMNSDMISAEYIGPIQFKGDPVDPESGKKLSTMYMEGPDLSVFSNGGADRVYLIFAAKNVDPGTERIGYATATLTEFRNNPSGCWDFKGWIIKGVLGSSDDDSHWTNHADLCQYNGKYYIFYHKIIDPMTYSSNRQVCAEQIYIEPNGDIQYWDSSYDLQDVPLPGSTDGPFSDRLRNVLSGNFLTVTGVSDYPTTAMQPRHNDWASQQWEKMDENNGFVRYRNKWSKWYLTATSTNEYAEVTTEPYNTGDSQKWKVENFGSGGTVKILKNAWSGNYLTATETTDGGIVACQPLHKDGNGNPDWSSQQWRLDGNRLCNYWASGDLTATGKGDGASTRVRPLTESWSHENWIPELVSTGTYRFRSGWSGKYLTCYNTDNGSAIVCKPLHLDDSGEPDWSSQEWIAVVTSGGYTFQNKWSGYYMTSQDGSKYSNVICKQLDSTLSGQLWFWMLK